MGKDKALLDFGGRPLVEYVAAQVARAAGSVTLLGPPERYALLGYPVLPDAEAGCGPLSGILSALAARQAEWNLIVACDMPYADAPWLAWLLELAEQAEPDCLLPAGPSGRPEPTCAVYHTRCLEVLRTAFSDGTRQVIRALEGLRVQTCPVEDPRRILNVNTPDEWSRIRG
jgi:molybdopterin-guanine dinucleotide biosynthesis protein A